MLQESLQAGEALLRVGATIYVLRRLSQLERLIQPMPSAPQQTERDITIAYATGPIRYLFWMSGGTWRSRWRIRRRILWAYLTIWKR